MVRNGTCVRETQGSADDRSFNTREAEAVVADPFDVALEDSDLLVEVELTTNLIIAATASDGPLPADEIDRILGVVPDDDLA
jgi:hypothetical protein